MKYTKEQRLDIGKRIYDGELSRYEAAEEYGISDQTARDYMRQYRDINNLPPKHSRQHTYGIARAKSMPAPEGLEDYESMTKEELIDALIMARINEARLKKAIWWKELVRRRRSFGSSRRIPSDHGAFRRLPGKIALREDWYTTKQLL